MRVLKELIIINKIIIIIIINKRVKSRENMTFRPNGYILKTAIFVSERILSLKSVSPEKFKKLSGYYCSRKTDM